MLLDLNDPHINRLAQTAEFGIERESLRVTYDGRLAQTKHPFDRIKDIIATRHLHLSEISRPLWYTWFLCHISIFHFQFSIFNSQKYF